MNRKERKKEGNLFNYGEQLKDDNDESKDNVRGTRGRHAGVRSGGGKKGKKEEEEEAAHGDSGSLPRFVRVNKRVLSSFLHRSSTYTKCMGDLEQSRWKTSCQDDLKNAFGSLAKESFTLRDRNSHIFIHTCIWMNVI